MPITRTGTSGPGRRRRLPGRRPSVTRSIGAGLALAATPGGGQAAAQGAQPGPPPPLATLAADDDRVAALVRAARPLAARPLLPAGARAALVQCAVVTAAGEPLAAPRPAAPAARLADAFCGPLVRAAYAALPYAWMREADVFAHAAVRARAGDPGSFDRYGRWGPAGAAVAPPAVAALARQLRQDGVLAITVVLGTPPAAPAPGTAAAVTLDRIELMQYSGAGPAGVRLAVPAAYRPAVAADAAGFARLSAALVARLAAAVPAAPPR